MAADLKNKIVDFTQRDPDLFEVNKLEQEATDIWKILSREFSMEAVRHLTEEQQFHWIQTQKSACNDGETLSYYLERAFHLDSIICHYHLSRSPDKFTTAEVTADVNTSTDADPGADFYTTRRPLKATGKTGGKTGGKSGKMMISLDMLVKKTSSK